MLMAAAAYNLKKLINFTGPKVVAMVKTMIKRKEKDPANLFSMLQALMMYHNTENYLLKPLSYTNP